MRTYQVYNQGRPTTIRLTPPERPLWQGRPIAPEPGTLSGLAMRLDEFAPYDGLEAPRDRD